MNLNRIVKLVEDEWGDCEWESTLNDGDMSIVSNLSFDDFDDDIRAEIDISPYSERESALVGIEFCFDAIDITKGALQLVNAFNESSTLLKAHISTENTPYLRLTYISPYVIEDDIFSTILLVMNELSDPDIIALLKPITLLTE